MEAKEAKTKSEEELEKESKLIEYLRSQKQVKVFDGKALQANSDSSSPRFDSDSSHSGDELPSKFNLTKEQFGSDSDLEQRYMLDELE